MEGKYEREKMELMIELVSDADLLVSQLKGIIDFSKWGYLT